MKDTRTMQLTYYTVFPYGMGDRSRTFDSRKKAIAFARRCEKERTGSDLDTFISKTVKTLYHVNY
jgi:hypothetical protein